MTSLYALIHSPLVGPSTWERVAQALRAAGHDALVPELRDDGPYDEPYWRRHAASVAEALPPIEANRAVVLVGHSGAGALLPAVRALSGRMVASYLFVDAGIPLDGESRLGPQTDANAWRREMLPLLEAGGAYPTWRDEDLRGIVPDDDDRTRLLSELRPRGLRFWTEPIPVFAGWPDTPAAFLHFSAAYDAAAQQALAFGWGYRKLPAGHFHMLVDPIAVAKALLDLSGGAPFGPR